MFEEIKEVKANLGFKWVRSATGRTYLCPANQADAVHIQLSGKPEPGCRQGRVAAEVQQPVGVGGVTEAAHGQSFPVRAGVTVRGTDRAGVQIDKQFAQHRKVPLPRLGSRC